jgi:hypothetical protein
VICSDFLSNGYYKGVGVFCKTKDVSHRLQRTKSAEDFSQTSTDVKAKKERSEKSRRQFAVYIRQLT